MSFKKFTILIISLFVYLLIPINNIYALGADSGLGTTAGVNSIVTRDPFTGEIMWKQTGQDLAHQLKTWALSKAEKAWDTAGSKALQSALGQALNTIAYDTATWLGSGGKGQSSQYFSEGFGEYVTNVADNAAGKFVEEFGRGNNFNLCSPSLNVRLKIGLSLAEQQRPPESPCTFSKMQENWENELQRDDFLNRFQDMFNPGSNDIGVALTLRSAVDNEMDKEATNAVNQRLEDLGWKPPTDAAGRRTSVPGLLPDSFTSVLRLKENQLNQTYEDEFVGAVNVFVNQLAYTAFRTMMENLNGNPQTSSYDWSKLLSQFDASKSNSGITGAEEQFKTVLEPDFSVRGDYNILAELTQCPNPNKAGPTNCVITDKFRSAIADKLTVGEALKSGYLIGTYPFGFISDGLEPKYNEGYPYRAMIILRKFRILPVGWELAAQWIKANADKVYTLNDLVNCFDSADGYGGPGSTEPWCEGLVDPNWVLKASLNYCAKEGPGPEILSEQVSGTGLESELTVNRNDEYCADEQTCVKENDDGSCEIYGYCTEEKRKWVFDAPSCEPNYNTCQSYQNENLGTVSFLKNTLDLGGDCNLGNVGCSEYALTGSYAAASGAITWETVNNLAYFDNDKDSDKNGSCTEKDEGCHEYIRTKAGLGANLIPNPGFEEMVSPTELVYWGPGLTTVNPGYNSTQALSFSGNFSHTIEVGPPSFNIGGQAYTLSFTALNCTDGVFGLRDSSGEATSTIFSASAAQRYSVSRVFPDLALGNDMEIFINVSGACTIDALKLERGKINNPNFSEYHADAVIQEKIIPEYLRTACYNADSTLRSDAPLECYQFARECNVTEVGCGLYTSKSDGLSIPAKISAQDECPAACVGYDSYLQSESNFDTSRFANLIPAQAGKCNLASAGCDEFTNLDKVEEGGEAREYYSELKQCIKPNTVGKTCEDFYVWEGSSNTGFQLKVVSLELDTVDGTYINDPKVTAAIDADYMNNCSEAVYNLDPTDNDFNSDCREFYNTSGDVSYHLLSKTITCSDNCHPYRRSEDNIDETIITQAACDALDAATPDIANDTEWDASIGAGVCHYCMNGGTWNTQQNACIYMAIPQEGRTCSAAQAGCREYTGNAGNVMNVILNHSFENGLSGWTGDVASSSLSQRSDGKSLRIEGGAHTASINLGYLVRLNSAYVLDFIAHADAANNITFHFENTVSGDISANFGATTLGNYWTRGEYNLPNLPANFTIDENVDLIVEGTGNFNLDIIKLTEVRDRYYLIKNNFGNLQNCYYDTQGLYVGDSYNLGCEAYTDSDNKTKNLHDFTALCQESAVGCELMIDTYNSSEYESSIWNDTNPVNGVCDEDGCVGIPQDDYKYIVYDSKKLCGADKKGCERLGEIISYDGVNSARDVYVVNNPDNYEDIMCDQEALMCDAWTTDTGGTEFFKDPGDQICEWTQNPGVVSGGWGWYNKKVKRCDVNSDAVIDSSENIYCQENSMCSAVVGASQCTANADCGANNVCVDGVCRYSCIVDEELDPCTVATSPDKTIGIGGNGNVIATPARDTISGENWVGTCPVSQSSCTEYLDPVSKFSVNLVTNSDFSSTIGPVGFDGWSGSGPYTQTLTLQPKTVYIVSIDAGNTLNLNSTAANIVRFDVTTNSFSNVSSNSILPLVSSGQTISTMFYYDSITPGIVNIAANNAAGNVQVKEAVVGYQLAKDLNEGDCNGVIDFEKGCVLFNERSQDGANIKSLAWDADAPGHTAVAGNNNSNVLLRVSPDRVCDNWLACRSYVKDEDGHIVCTDIGKCENFDEKGNCSSFVSEKKENQIYIINNSSLIANVTGYSKVAYDGTQSAFEEVNDYYDLGEMEQSGQSINVYNGNFELYTANRYPVGWYMFNSTTTAWTVNVFKIINNPYEAQKEGVNYNPEGQAFLKVGNSYRAASEMINLNSNSNYVVSAYLNTKQLYSGAGRIRIVGYNANNTVVSNSVPTSEPLELDSGKDWQLVSGNIESINLVGIHKIKLVIEANLSQSGSLYVDDIKIKSALSSKEDYYTTQSCRLFPDTDSLSCEYYQDSGIKVRGIYGYCLEYDRNPGNKDACLLWYPVDRVQDNSILANETSAYSGKTPLYYCTETANKLNATVALCAKKGHCCQLEVSLDGSYHVHCQFGSYSPWVLDSLWANNEDHGEWVGDFPAVTDRDDPNFWTDIPFDPDEAGCDAISDWGCVNVTEDAFENDEGDIIDYWRLTFFSKMNNHSGTRWENRSVVVPRYPSNKGVCLDYTNYNVDSHSAYMEPFPISGFTPTYCDSDFSNCDKCLRNMPECTKIVQTVNPSGKAMPWTSRVSEGSDFVIDCNSGIANSMKQCNYDSNNVPFGSTLNLVPSINPFEWDSNPSQSEKQPLYFQNINNPMMGQVQSIDDGLKRLFAESYGSWEWMETGICSENNLLSCNTDGNQCPFGECQGRWKLNYNGSIFNFDVDDSIVDYQICTSPTIGLGDTAGSGVTVLSYVDVVTGAAITHSANSLNAANSCLPKNTICDDLTMPAGCGSNCPAECCSGYSDLAEIPDAAACSTQGGIWSGVTCYFTDNTCDSYYATIAVTDELCALSHEICTASTDCDNFSSVCTGDICAGGDRDGLICDAPQICDEECVFQDTARSLGAYVKTDEQLWAPPTDLCRSDATPLSLCSGTGANTRPANECEICGVAPEVTEIKLNGLTTNVTLNRLGLVKIEVNTLLDPEQLPITYFDIDWGDHEKTILSAVELSPRPDEDNPHVFYHVFDYWDMQLKKSMGLEENIYCGNGGTVTNYLGVDSGESCPSSGTYCCMTRPEIVIRDNWGWCNARTVGTTTLLPTAPYDCDQAQPFNSWLIINER